MKTIRHDEHPLDRAAMLALRAMIALRPAMEFGPEARAGFDAMMEKTPAADGVAYEATTVGGVPGWWCRPAAAIDRAALLYLHGGAYVVGSASSYRGLASQLAVRARADVFVPDYALAPERTFPAAFDDAMAVYRGLAGMGRRRLAVTGDSAGGGLALALLSALAKDSAVPSPVAAVVLSPWADLTLSGESMETRAHADPLLSRERLRAPRDLYLAGHDGRDPRASPIFGPLADLPPVLVHVGEDEVLLDDARRYAAEVARAGGVAELHVWAGMVHVFLANFALLEAARDALDLSGAFLRTHLVEASE